MKDVRSSLIALVVALCLLMPMSTRGLVLCIGTDGHMRFEPARNSRCTTLMTPTATLSQQITPSTSPPDHCGPCVDVPLLTSDADAQQFVPTFPLVLQLEVPGLALVSWVVPAAPALAFTPVWLSLPRVTNTTLSALRTVMLLL